MKVFVAGASGTIGVPLVRALVKAGHDVTAMTRTPSKLDALRALSATPVVADALDGDAVARAVAAAGPDVVIHQLTALPKAGGVKRASDLEPTNRLRIDGTRNLLAAAVAARARRIIVGSFAPLRAAGPGADNAGENMRPATEAVVSMESQVLEASHRHLIEGVVLRYGLFYGPDNPATQNMIAMAKRRMLPVIRGDQSLLPVIHVDDAISATIAALDHGEPGGVYEIVDDRPVSMTEIVTTLADRAGAPRPFTVPAWIPRLFAPYMAQITSVRLRLSNAGARAALGWRPAYPTIADGLSRTLSRAA
jgi:nucleoside-diphosphate-sugar epimerase